MAFSTAPIEKVEIKINDEPWIDCNHIEGPLYTVKWNPALYNSGIQIIRARVEDKDGKQKEITQPFVLDGTRLSFKLLSRFILMSNATTIVSIII